MKASLRIALESEDQVGDARRQAADLARSLQGGEAFAGRFPLLATEAARNVVRHGGGGEILLRCLHHGTRAGLELLAVDKGRGMANVHECMRDGHSTGGTAGEGLGALRRQADALEVYSRPDAGTVVWAQVWLPVAGESPAPRSRYVLGVVNVAVIGETECGDAWTLVEESWGWRLLLADGLGHGPQAAAAAHAAVQRLPAEQGHTLVQTMGGLHAAVEGTRGAAVAVLDARANQVEVCGVGNIAGRIAGGGFPATHVVSMPGTVGVKSRTPQAFTYPWRPGQLLIVHSDGLSASWKLEQYPGLESRHPAVIAGVLYRDHARVRDDVTVVVLRSAIR